MRRLQCFARFFFSSKPARLVVDESEPLYNSPPPDEGVALERSVAISGRAGSKGSFEAEPYGGRRLSLLNQKFTNYFGT